jgi:Ice-binding-like
MSKKLNSLRNSTQLCQSRGYSKPLNAIWPLVLLLFVFTTGCNKENSTPSPTPILTSKLATNAMTINAVNPDIDFAPVNLRTAGNFTILSETGISTTGTTSILGNIGVSPIAAAAITGFGLILDPSNQFSHTPIVTGKVYAANYAPPTPSKMTTAVSDMKTAFTTANGLIFPAPIVNLYAGNISGRTLAPGVYKWSTGLLISNVGVTLNGAADDVWVFQIAENLTVNNGAIITLRGGALAKNIFWVVTGKATLGTTVNFSGVILSKTLISLNTGAKVNGKLLAQTAVTLIANSVRN